MIAFPNAKINLGLYVTARRTDGYHDIQSVMVPVPGLKDALEIIPSSGERCGFSSSGIPFDCPEENNLCVKAWRLMRERYGIGGVKMHLLKKIPFGAGTGGGSSDAVFTLKLLDRLFETGIDSEEMERLAATLGSDTIFFVDNRPAYVTGRGEVVRSIDLDLTGYTLLAVKPNIAVSTGSAYTGIVPSEPRYPLVETVTGDPARWKDRLSNDFEATVFARHPELAVLKRKMYDFGAVYASMSGSGATVYGLFRPLPDRLPVFPGCHVHIENF